MIQRIVMFCRAELTFVSVSLKQTGKIFAGNFGYTSLYFCFLDDTKKKLSYTTKEYNSYIILNNVFWNSKWSLFHFTDIQVHGILPTKVYAWHSCVMSVWIAFIFCKMVSALISCTHVIVSSTYGTKI